MGAERDTKSIEAPEDSERARFLAQSAKCMEPLHPDWVETRAGRGGSGALSYVSGFYVTKRLCDIFGPLGWSKTTDVLEEVCRIEGEDKYKKPQWRVTYRATVTLTAWGVSKTDSGAGHGIGKDLGECIESALKEAETDALKRAAMRFGLSLGLALYDKEREFVGAPRDSAPSPECDDVNDVRPPPPVNVRKLVHQIDQVDSESRLKAAEDYAQSIMDRVTSDPDRLAIVEAIARATSRVKKRSES